MASLISGVTSVLGSGRSRVALLGPNRNDFTVEIEIDLVESFDVTYSTQISTHAIEKDPNNPVGKISDHVQPENPTVSSSCILSDDVISDTSAKDKLKQLIFWQKSGSLITMEGYTVGSNAFGKVINTLKRGFGNFNSDLKEPHYLGMVTDRIENIVLGNIIAKNTTDLGNDIGVTLNFSRIQIVEAKTKSRSSKSTSNSRTISKKGNTQPQEVATKKELNPAKKSQLKAGT